MISNENANNKPSLRQEDVSKLASILCGSLVNYKLVEEVKASFELVVHRSTSFELDHISSAGADVFIELANPSTYVRVENLSLGVGDLEEVAFNVDRIREVLEGGLCDFFDIEPTFQR